LENRSEPPCALEILSAPRVHQLDLVCGRLALANQQRHDRLEPVPAAHATHVIRSDGSGSDELCVQGEDCAVVPRHTSGRTPPALSSARTEAATAAVVRRLAKVGTRKSSKCGKPRDAFRTVFRSGTSVPVWRNPDDEAGCAVCGSPWPPSEPIG